MTAGNIEHYFGDVSQELQLATLRYTGANIEVEDAGEAHEVYPGSSVVTIGEDSKPSLVGEISTRDALFISEQPGGLI